MAYSSTWSQDLLPSSKAPEERGRYMSRQRVIGLRRHKATNTHYATLPDGKFKYFSKDPATAESQYAAWLNSLHANPKGLPADSSSNIAQSASGGNASLTTVRAVFNA